MKKILSIVMVCILTTMMFVTAIPVSAAGASVTVSASSTKPTVGSTFTVTVKYTADKAIGSFEGSIKYDASVMEYVSIGNGVGSPTSSSGVLPFVWYDASYTAKSKSFTITFKAKKAGSGAVTITTSELVDQNFGDLGTPSGKVTVNVQNPQKSGNANLSALYISSGSLSPKFSPKVTSYNIVIPNSVTVLTLSAETEDKDATIAIEGSKNMKVGKNTRKVIVTAPNGTTKTYTLNITRQEATGNVTTPSDKTPQNGDKNEAAKVTVDDQVLYIVKDLKNVKLPQGYEQGKITINDTQFPSVQDKNRNIVLLYLADEKGENGAFYVYDTVSMTFSEFYSLKVTGGEYALLSPDATVMIPEGFTQTFIKVNEQTVAAWSFPEEEMSSYLLVYALSPGGTKGLYQYDTVEGTLQRYTHRVTAFLPVEEEVEDTAPTESGGLLDVFNNLLARFGMLRLILMGVGILILITAIVILIVLLTKKQRPKH